MVKLMRITYLLCLFFLFACIEEKDTQSPQQDASAKQGGVVDPPITTFPPNEEEPAELFQDITQELGMNFPSGRALAVSDINGDGLQDVYIGGPSSDKGFFAVQQPDGTFLRKDLLQGADEQARYEGEFGALFFDVDQDGDEDLYWISGGNEVDVQDSRNQDGLFRNDEGTFTLLPSAIPAFLGSSSVVKAADYDKDGDLDLFVGVGSKSVGSSDSGFSYLLKNESSAAEITFSIDSTSAPGLRQVRKVRDALWTDYDGNGSFDLLLAAEAMPLILLKNTEGIFEEVTSQSGLENHMGGWNSLAAGDFDRDGDIDYVAGNLDKSNQLTTNSLGNSYVENLGDGNFSIQALPPRSQSVPFYGVLVEDFDGDAKLDVLMVGNDSQTEKSFMRSSACKGSFLKGNGKGGFEVLSVASSGFCLAGEGLAMVRLEDGEGNTRIMVSQHAAPLNVFSQRIAAQYVPLTPLEFSGYFHFPDGTKQIWELGYGTSFLSQSSRSIQVPEGVIKLEVHDSQGNVRMIE